MSDVPDEILREILSRLPVAPLLRFRCVSKSWKGFIKQLLNHSRKTNSNLNITLRSCHLYSSDFDLLNVTNMAAFKELSHPLIKATHGITEILGSCDGLLVLRNDKDDVTLLRNPSVRRFHEVPFSGIEFPGDNMDIFYGFGYDVVSDDYKLIRIVHFFGKDNDELNSEVKVYSLKSDSWRRIPDFLYYIYYRVMVGVLANGALHWTLTGDNLVVAFDLGTEEFRVMPLPKFASDDIYMNVVVLGGCLSLMCYVNKDNFDIWVMKEGVQESWSTLFTFHICDFDFDFMTPLAYSKCDRKVLIELYHRVLMWYDLDEKSIGFKCL